jgi:hypothetical protein
MGGVMNKRYFSFIFLTILIAVNISGCVDKPAARRYQQVDSFGFEIHNLFTPLVNALGELRSPAITDIFVRNSVYYQYTLAYLMVYNPAAPIGQQYRLFPLGRNLPIQMPPVAASSGEELVVDGYVIWQELIPTYKMYGANLIGPPLTDLMLNIKENRFEQYFTNMAFYRYVDQPEGEFMLMPYGAWYCEDICKKAHEVIKDRFYPLPPADRVTVDNKTRAQIALINFAEFLGPKFTGESISEMFTNAEGQYVHIYENVVMLIDPRFLSDVHLLDLPAEVGVVPDDPKEQTSEPGSVFYPILKGKGFIIPLDIFEFVERFGGIKVSGPPIKHVYALDNRGLGQCFEHYCLEYQPSASPGARIKLLPLGRKYYLKITQDKPETDEKPTVPRSMIVKVWERYPLLPQRQAQEIGVAAFDGNRPLNNVNFYLTLLLPDGTQRVYFLRPTNSEGQTQIILDPIDLPKGTMVPYQVCVVSVSDTRACLNESFLIWDDG